MRLKASWVGLMCRTYQYYRRQWLPNNEWSKFQEISLRKGQTAKKLVSPMTCLCFPNLIHCNPLNAKNEVGEICDFLCGSFPKPRPLPNENVAMPMAVFTIHCHWTFGAWPPSPCSLGSTSDSLFVEWMYFTAVAITTSIIHTPFFRCGLKI